MGKGENHISFPSAFSAGGGSASGGEGTFFGGPSTPLRSARGRVEGVTLIEVVLSIGIIVMLFGGIYAVYIAILDHVANANARAAASSLLSQELEIIRNLSYDAVGTVGGVPAGILAASKNATSTEGYGFNVKTTVRNIDDPFDGTLGGTPNDTAPADYKLVELEASCTSCPNFVPLILTANVAPKNLESAGSAGSLFVSVFDASAVPLQGATVRVTNASVTPSIDLTDFTNASGVLQLVGVPTSTQRYHITVTKSGYSSDQTYPAGDPSNPNPLKTDATVAAQAVTQTSFAIDRVSTVTVKTVDDRCAAVGNAAFTLAGAKLIGTSPTVVKFSTSSATDAAGTKTFSNMEWDTYALAVSTSTYDIAGHIPLQPVTVNPNSTVEAKAVLQASSSRAVLVTVKDAVSGAAIANATTSVSGGSYSETRTTGRHTATDTDWSGGAYASQDGGIDADGVPGMFALIGPPYSTSTESWLVSRTVDAGGTGASWYSFSWGPDIQPAGTAVRFQIASNNDNATWNFLGPDGTGGTFYTATGTVAAAHQGNRYLRYKAFLSTTDGGATPTVQDVSVVFRGPCVPLAQSLFTGMSAGDYTALASAAGYATATTTVTVGSGWQEVVMSLVPSP